VAEWGLHSLDYYDNASRACIAALNIQKAVKEFILLTNVQDISSADQSEDDNQFSQIERSRAISVNRTIRLRQNNNITGVDTLSEGAVIENFDLPIHVGIATGEVFQAIVGDGNSKAHRLEVDSIGEAYTRAQSLLTLA